MDEFAAKFHTLILEKRALAQAARQHHINRTKDLEHRALQLRLEIAAGREAAQKIVQTIESSLADLTAKQRKVEGLRAQLETLQQTRIQREKEAADARAEASNAEESLRYARHDLASQARQDATELTKYEMYLGLKVVAVDEDVLRFRFYNVSADDVDKEVMVELNVAGEDYRVVAMEPTLLADMVSGMEDALNDSGDFVAFLKQMRKALRDA